MPIFDEQVPLAQGSDSGQNDPSSIQPIEDNEVIWPEVQNRPLENLRVRTETLRAALENANYFADYDRGLLLKADGAFTFTEVSPGNYTLTFTDAGRTLWVYPALSPGRLSGGREEGGRVFCSNPSAGGAWTPYVGTYGSDDLVLVAYRQSTGQRGYADGDDIAISPSARSLGANRILVDLYANPGITGGALSISATITGAPRTKIAITYGSATPTTLADLINFINTDRTSQGSYGVADFLRAHTTGADTNPPVPFTGGRVQGAYDAEAHQVTAAQLDAFFSAVDGAGVFVNRLQEGEGLAVGYPAGPVERGVPSPRGGRRQSIWDLPTDRLGTRVQNTTPAAGWSLFSTGREPEKIPGAIPIGKVVNGVFVFLDGTTIAPGESLSLGESRTMYAVLASWATGFGGSRIGYEGTPAWHSDAAGTSRPDLQPDWLSNAVSEIVLNLAVDTTAQSGARRIGIETLAGDSTVGNESRIYSLPSGSIRQALADLMIASNGINRRVSEFGHRMSGPSPLRKDFDAADMPARGSVFLQSLFHAPVNLTSNTPAGVSEYHSIVLQPIVYSINPSTDFLAAVETATVSTATSLDFTGEMSLTRFVNVFQKLPVVLDSGTTTTVYPLLVVKLTNLSGAANARDGLYYIVSRNTGTGVVVFKNIDGTDPDFTGAGTINVTFCSSHIVGSNALNTRTSSFQITHDDWPQHVIGAHGVNAMLLQVSTPNGNSGSPQMEVWANRMQFRGGLKKTDNILGDLDYALLNGIESGAVVSADASHHHAAYTEYASCAATPTLLLNVAAMSTIDGVTVTSTCIAAVPAGTRRKAVTLNVELYLQPNSLVMHGDWVGCRITFRQPGGVGVATLVEGYIQVLDGDVTGVTYSRTLTIEMDAASHTHFDVSLITKTNLNASASTIHVEETVQYLQTIDH